MRTRGLLGAGLLALLSACEEPPPGPLLIDRTAESGIDFRHVHGGRGRRELPETMGGGVALFDYDADGDVDAYFAQSGAMRVPGRTVRHRQRRNVLYSNDGAGAFAVVPGAAGADDDGYGQGVTCGDWNGDGRDDLLSLDWGPNRLYENLGGSFREVGREAGLAQVDEWSISAAFFDADGDGDLDLYVVNYLVAEPGSYARMNFPQGFPGYPHPDRFDGQADRFYRNDGGHLVDRTVPAGLHRPSGKGLGVVPTDVDLDGQTDLYVANDSTPNFLFRGLGDAKFEEIGLLAGVAYNEDGQTEAGMGLDTGDVDGDGDFDLFVTNLDGETNTLYRNELRRRGRDGEVRDGRLSFTDATQDSGLAEVSRNLVGFGALLNDMDFDGDLDLLIVNGHVLDNAHLLSDVRTYAQPNQVFLGDGTGRFAPPPPERRVPGLEVPTVSRGTACADLNGDGALDFVVTANNAPPQVWFGNPGRGRSLALSLEGPAGNPHGVGSTVRLELEDGRTTLLRIESARSYASASQPLCVTGLPARVRAVEVVWPGGERERWSGFERPFEGSRRLVHGSSR